VDSKGMNRIYPGKPDGTQTERASWAVTKEVIEKCDYLIDYHGGDLDENLRRYSYWADTGNAAMDAVSRRMRLLGNRSHLNVHQFFQAGDRKVAGARGLGAPPENTAQARTRGIHGSIPPRLGSVRIITTLYRQVGPKTFG